MPHARAFWLLLGGYSVSSYGNFLNLVALGLFSFHWSQSTWFTGAVMAVRLGAGFLAGLVCGRVLDRLPRRPLLVGLDLLQATAMVALILAPSLITFVGVALVLGAGNTTLVVALRSGIPELVGADQRTRANGRLVTARSLASVLGFGTAALVIDLGGFDAAFLVNAASFLVSATAQAFVSWPERAPQPSPPTSPDEASPRSPRRSPSPVPASSDPATLDPAVPDPATPDPAVPDRASPGPISSASASAGPARSGPLSSGSVSSGSALSGSSARGPVSDEAASREPDSARPGRRGGRVSWPWQYLPVVIAGMIAVRGVDALASAGHNVALPIYATLIAPADPAAVSTQFLTAWAIGSVSAHQLVSRVLKQLDHRAFAAATCAMSVCFVLAFTGLPAAGLIAVCLLAGIADGVSEIGYLSTLQTRPEHQRTRVFGLSASVESSAFAGGMLLAGGLLDVLPVLPVVAGLHGVAVLGVLVFLLLSRRRSHEVVDHPRSPAGADRG